MAMISNKSMKAVDVFALISVFLGFIGLFDVFKVCDSSACYIINTIPIVVAGIAIIAMCAWHGQHRMNRERTNHGELLSDVESRDIISQLQRAHNVQEGEQHDVPEHVQCVEEDNCSICDGNILMCPLCHVPTVRNEPLRGSQAVTESNNEENNLCIICSDNSQDAILLNCGHTDFCLQCAYQCMENLNNNPEGPTCPICRYPIVGAVKRNNQTAI